MKKEQISAVSLGLSAANVIRRISRKKPIYVSVGTLCYMSCYYYYYRYT